MNDINKKATASSVNIRIESVERVKKALSENNIKSNGLNVNKLINAAIEKITDKELYKIAAEFVDYHEYLEVIKKNPDLQKLIQEKIESKKKIDVK